MSKHLWEKHQIPTEAREGLNPFVKSLRLPNPNKLELRRDGSAPHPHLAIKSGAACKQCDYRSTSLDLMRRHMSKTHGRKSNRKNWLGDEIRENLQLQSWTQKGSRGYWIVGSGGHAAITAALPSSECSPRRQRRVGGLREEEQQRIDEVEHNPFGNRHENRRFGAHKQSDATHRVGGDFRITAAC